jgi:hypothetical protein
MIAKIKHGRKSKFFIFAFALTCMQARLSNADPSWDNAFAGKFVALNINNAIRTTVFTPVDAKDEYYDHVSVDAEDEKRSSDNIIPQVEAIVISKGKDIHIERAQAKLIASELLSIAWTTKDPDDSMGVSPGSMVIIPDDARKDIAWILEFYGGSNNDEFSVKMSLVRPCGANCYQHWAHTKNTGFRRIAALDELAVLARTYKPKRVRRGQSR